MRLILLLATTISVWAQADWREAMVDGRRIRYQAVDGEAIWQGDIILGSPENLGKGTRASAVLSGQRFRWLANTIPYVIADDVPDKARVDGAVQHWNEKTPIRLVPRQNEANYVEFRRRNGASCSSSVGMLGGRQFINLPDDCSLGSIVHEIGHTVGLYHTQSREDRDIFLRIRTDAIERTNVSQYAQQIATSDDVGAYPFDSIMHYSVVGFALPGGVTMETIPSGIPLGQRDGLTASDIDTVIRIYGGQPAKTVIASNPSGIDIVVDGETARTPAEFAWPVGSRHTVRVDDATVDNAELRFGRWSDFGAREHSITATPASTVYTAQMRRLYRLPLSAVPAGSGQVTISPPQEDGLVPDGQLVALRAEPAAGFAFTNWSGVGFFSSHGSANPARLAVTSGQLSYTASFSRSVLTTLTTSPPGLRIQVDGTTYTAPRRFLWTAGTRHDVSVDAVNQNSLGGAAMNSWRAWSDGGDQRHTVIASANGGTITAEFDTRYQVLSGTSPFLTGRVLIDPSPVDGFLPAGTALTVSAVPANGFAFAGWSGTISGSEPTQTLTVEGDQDLQAQFAQPFTITGAGIVNGATFGSGPIAPGQILSLFGLDIGPPELAGLTLTAQRRVATIAGEVRVLFDGAPAPVIYASSRQVGTIVPYNVAGKTAVRVQLEYRGRLTNSLTMNVASTAPGFFTAQSSGRGGGAFLNADGSLNSEANPAERGSIVVLYATGLGVMRPAMNDGELAAPPYPQPAASYKVRIADRDCEVLYGGAAPGLVAGLVQLNVRVPAELAPGVVPVSLESGGLTSPRTVSMALR